MFSIKIVPSDVNGPAGKLADAEIHFDHRSGPMEGLKLIGFSIWAPRSANAGRNITFPARTYSVNGERRSFALLRPSGEVHTAQDAIRDAILAAYADLEDGGPGIYRHDPPRTPAAALDPTKASDYPSETAAKTGPILEAEPEPERPVTPSDFAVVAEVFCQRAPEFQTEAERMAAGMKAARQPGGVLLSDLMPGGKYGKAKTPAPQRFTTPTLEF